VRPARHTPLFVTRGLDPWVHPLRNDFLRAGWIAGSSPAMTTAIVPLSERRASKFGQPRVEVFGSVIYGGVK